MRVLAILGLALGAIGSLFGQTITATFQPVADATMSSACPDTPLGANPSYCGSPSVNHGTKLAIGRNQGYLTPGTSYYRSCIRFNVCIPAGATILSAILDFDLDMSAGSVFGPVFLYTADAPWSESTITYNTTNAWGGVGPSISLPSTTPTSAFNAVNVLPIVSAWNSGAVPNNGFYIIGVPTMGLVVFGSRESPSWSPELVVTYTGGGAPSITAVAPEGGPQSGGTTFTILGSGFVPGCTTVSLEYPSAGSQPVTLLGTSTSTSITCVTPSMLAVGPVNLRVATPSGWTQTTFYSSYKPEFYGNVTPGTGGQYPTVEIDWVSSTSTQLQLRVTGTLPNAQVYIAAGRYHTGYPTYWAWSTSNGVWMNLPTTYFGVDAAILTYFGLFQYPSQISLFTNIAVNNYTPGLSLQANTAGVATHQMNLASHGLTPPSGGTTNLYLQAYAEDANGGTFPMQEIWGLAVSSAFAYFAAPETLAALGPAAVQHIGGVYLAGQQLPLPASIGWDAANTLAQWMSNISPVSLQTVSTLAWQYFLTLLGPNLTVSGSRGQWITYYGP